MTLVERASPPRYSRAGSLSRAGGDIGASRAPLICPSTCEIVVSASRQARLTLLLPNQESDELVSAFGHEWFQLSATGSSFYPSWLLFNQETTSGTIWWERERKSILPLLGINQDSSLPNDSDLQPLIYHVADHFNHAKFIDYSDTLAIFRSWIAFRSGFTDKTRRQVSSNIHLCHIYETAL